MSLERPISNFLYSLNTVLDSSLSHHSCSDFSGEGLNQEELGVQNVSSVPLGDQHSTHTR